LDSHRNTKNDEIKFKSDSVSCFLNEFGKSVREIIKNSFRFIYLSSLYKKFEYNFRFSLINSIIPIFSGKKVNNIHSFIGAEIERDSAPFIYNKSNINSNNIINNLK
jgi:hypothetical protein